MTYWEETNCLEIRKINVLGIESSNSDGYSVIIKEVFGNSYKKQCNILWKPSG